MNKFKVGDKVRRVGGPDTKNVKIGGVYEVTSTGPDSICLDVSLGVNFLSRNFELVKEDTSNYYKHYDMVIAWMQGKGVQIKCTDGTWSDISKVSCRTTVPAFHKSTCYRIKPEPCPKEDKLTSLVSKLEEQLKEAQEQLKEMRNE